MSPWLLDRHREQRSSGDTTLRAPRAPLNAAGAFLDGHDLVGTGVGADARVPWSVAGPGPRLRRYACTPTWPRSRGRADIGLDRLEHDQIQDRRRFGVRSQPT